MTTPVDMGNSHAKWLRQAAAEIAKEGHNGWGNTCDQAADEIDRLCSALTASELRVQELKAAHREEIKDMQKEFRDEIRLAVSEARAEEREGNGYGF